MVNEHRPLDLASLFALCNRATPGPWVTSSEISRFSDGDVRMRHAVTNDRMVIAVSPHDREDDMEFVAQARTVMPELVSEVSRLEKDLELEREANEQCVGRTRELERLIQGMTSLANGNMAEILKRYSHLEREAQWLAEECARLQSDWYSETSSDVGNKPPETRPSYWRKVARDAVSECRDI